MRKAHARRASLVVRGAAVALCSTCALGAGAELSAPFWISTGVSSDPYAIADTPPKPAQVWLAQRQGFGEPSLHLSATMLAQSDDSTAANRSQPAVAASALEFGANKSYSIPAMEIMGFDFLLNRINHQVSGSSDYDVTGATIRSNLRGTWVTDNDPYKVNQFGHPYQGSMYHGFARSAGLGYWESAGYTFLGSVGWEIAGEKTRPAVNDQVASGIAGSFLGETLFRMSSLVLEQGYGMPKFWREVAAAAISPSNGFNRLAYGERFKPVFSSRGAYYYSRLQLGLSAATHNVQGTSTVYKPNEVLADYYMEYGLPGKAGYEYTRPFDYFAFQATASSANVFENILTRGLLVGRGYEKGRDFRGVWGLYGSYDYISPQTYRISSTALSLGTTGQWWLSQDIALQGTAMLGAGYAAVSTLHGGATDEYHYGVAPQALMAMRFVFGDRAALGVTAREYFVSHVGSGGTGGRDNIARADVSFTMRLAKQHSVALKYLWNRRDATYSFLGNGTQERSTIGIFYSYEPDSNLGAVEWR